MEIIAIGDSDGVGEGDLSPKGKKSPTLRKCAFCNKSLSKLGKRQGTRYCSSNCKQKAYYQATKNKKEKTLHKKVTVIG